MTSETQPRTQQGSESPCGLFRRLAAMFYDGFLIIALLMAATLIVVLPLRDAVPSSNPFFQAYLLVVCWAYFALSWRAGQTVGMKAWNIHIVGQNESISWADTGIRFLVSIVSWAALGLGFVWSLFHPRCAAWHDLASGTRLVVRPRKRAVSGSEKST